MALGAAPMSKLKGMPAVTREAKRMTWGATPKYWAMTRETGKEMAMAATFMMKLVITKTKKAMPRTNTSQGALRKKDSQCTASHSAALVLHKQKPMDMAPPNSRMMFQGMVSRSSTVRVRVRKKSNVPTSMMPARSMSVKAFTGRNALSINNPTMRITVPRTIFSLRFKGPNSLVRSLAFFLSPAMTDRSGLKQVIIINQMANIIKSPRGSM